jgi:fermentation-respiration switch protein FrsA (DUF1100 family)
VSRLGLAALALLLGLGGLGFLSVGMIDRVIFQPTPGADVDPAALGLEAEEVRLHADDGVALHAWHLPARGTPLGLSLLFLHGNAGNASHRLPNAGQLAALGADVLLLDYRGYGLSEGRPSEAGLYRDAHAAFAHLTTARGRPPERIVVFGRSLGGAVAVELAQGRPLAGLVLESTFSSVADVARASLGFGLGPLVRDRFPTLGRIRALRAPVLFFHGDRDEIVPIDLGRRLFARAPEPKWFETVRGAGHNDLVMVGGVAYFERLRDFLRDVAPGGAHAQRAAPRAEDAAEGTGPPDASPPTSS